MNFLTPQIVQTALEVGLIYGLVALSLFISFSILISAICPRTAVIRWDVRSEPL